MTAVGSGESDVQSGAANDQFGRVSRRSQAIGVVIASNRAGFGDPLIQAELEM
jgi:hypothetical protein